MKIIRIVILGLLGVFILLQLLPVKFITIHVPDNEIVTDENELEKLCPEKDIPFITNGGTGEKIYLPLALSCQDHWKARSVWYKTKTVEVTFAEFTRRDFKKGKWIRPEENVIEPVANYFGTCGPESPSSIAIPTPGGLCHAWLNTPNRR